MHLIICRLVLIYLHNISKYCIILHISYSIPHVLPTKLAKANPTGAQNTGNQVIPMYSSIINSKYHPRKHADFWLHIV